MALDFDSRNAPRNHADLKRLTQAVRRASKADETLWLEWKAELNLNPADRGDKSGRAHVARAIIGFANRDPDEASRLAEGHGYLLVGVDHERMPGVEQHDITELVRWITPYIGEEIRWMPTYVEAEGDDGTVSILVVIIDPPKWGDPIHCMRKEAPGKSRDKSIAEAAIFVRTREGQTRPAKAREIDSLSHRILHRPTSINVDLQVLSGAVQPLSSTETEIAAWLQREERAALASLDNHLTASSQPLASRSGLLPPHRNLLSVTPEERTPEQYRQAVRRYLIKCRDQLPEAIEEAAAVHVVPVTLRLTNMTATNLESVQVHLYIPGEVHAIEVRSDMTADNETFPTSLPSRPYYGPRPRFSFGSPTYLQGRNLVPRTGEPSIQIDNGGSARVQLPAVHLRPDQHVDLEPFVVVSAPGETGPIIGEWSATCTNHDGSRTGSVTLPLAVPKTFDSTFQDR